MYAPEAARIAKDWQDLAKNMLTELTNDPSLYLVDALPDGNFVKANASDFTAPSAPLLRGNHSISRLVRLVPHQKDGYVQIR